MPRLKYSKQHTLQSHAFFAWLAACILTGCAGGVVTSERNAEQAVSQQVAITDSQQRAKVHTELGSLYLQKGNVAVALDEGRIALAADASYAPAYNLMGLSYMQLRENVSAEKSFEEALRMAPNDPEINNNFGWFLCQTGREQQSLAYFNNAIKNPLYSTPAMPNTNAGQCLLRIKDDKGAEEYFMRALRLESGNVRALYFLADINYRQARYVVARQYLQELHKLTSPAAETLWLAVRIERKLGDREDELTYASQLNRKFHGSPEQIKLSQGKFE